MKITINFDQSEKAIIKNVIDRFAKIGDKSGTSIIDRTKKLLNVFAISYPSFHYNTDRNDDDETYIEFNIGIDLLKKASRLSMIATSFVKKIVDQYKEIDTFFKNEKDNKNQNVHCTIHTMSAITEMVVSAIENVSASNEMMQSAYLAMRDVNDLIADCLIDVEISRERDDYVPSKYVFAIMHNDHESIYRVNQIGWYEISQMTIAEKFVLIDMDVESMSDIVPMTSDNFTINTITEMVSRDKYELKDGKWVIAKTKDYDEAKSYKSSDETDI